MKLCIVIPAYNEAPVIAATLHALSVALEKEFADTWEIIVADNASIDGTGDVVRKLTHPRIRVERIEKKGKGNALRAVFAKSDATLFGFTDADLSVPPEEVAAFAKVFMAQGKGVLIGSRFHKQSKMPGREWWRVGSSRIFNILARTILGVTVSDTQCPLKLMGPDGLRVMLATKEDTWFFDLEWIALLDRLHIPITEVPVTWDEHRYPDRKSKLSTVKDGARAVLAMFRIRSRLPAQLATLANIQ